MQLLLLPLYWKGNASQQRATRLLRAFIILYVRVLQDIEVQYIAMLFDHNAQQ